MSKKIATPEAEIEIEEVGTLEAEIGVQEVDAFAAVKAEFALSGYKTVLIPIGTDENGAILEQRLATLPADNIPADAIDIGEPAPVQDNGEMVLISNTGGVVRVPAASLKDYPGYARAVAEVHF